MLSNATEWHPLSQCFLYAVKAQMSLALLSRVRGSRATTAHAHQYCRFQSYAKTVPSRMKLTMKLRMREPHSWDLWQRTTWSRRVTSDFNSVLFLFSKCTEFFPMTKVTYEEWNIQHNVCVDFRHVVKCCWIISYLAVFVILSIAFLECLEFFPIYCVNILTCLFVYFLVIPLKFLNTVE